MNTSRTNYNLWTIILFFVLLIPKVGIGQSPIAVNDTFYVFKETPLTGNLVNNDIDFSGNGLLINALPITLTNHGTFALDPTQGELTYTPNSLFIGIDSCTYEVCSNGIGLCDTGTVYINVVDFFMSGTVTNASNCVLSDGNITIHSTADTISAFNVFEYSIDWGNTWQDSILFSNLAVGNYTIIGREKGFSLGLNDTINLTVSAPNIPTIDSVVIVSPSYSGAFNGQISISATGNNLIYSIYNGTIWQLNPIFNNLSFGSYSVQVKDQITQCTDTQIVQIVNDTNQIIANNDTFYTIEGLPIPAYQNLLSNDIDSIGNGLTVSSLLTSPSNGNFIYHPNGSFNYWPNYNFTGVDSFQYIISAMGLLPYDTATVYIHVVPFQVSATVNNYGCNNNRITVHNNLDSIFSTSNLNLEYSIDSGHTWQANPVFWVSNGTHQIIVQDISGAGLLDTVLVTISGDTPPTINALSWVNPVNCSASDGSITIAATGTGLPIEYSITNGLNWQSSPTFNNLSEGFYDVKIRNNNGTCPVSYINNPVQLASVNPITITNISTIAPTRCDTADGSINITANTTTGNPLEYSINNGSTWQSFSTFSGLYEGGYYRIVVRELNTNNCWAYHPTTINFPTSAAPNPISIDSIQYTNPTDCGVTDGTITVYATSNTLPYSLEYSIDNGINYQSSNIFTGLQGNYNYPIIVRNINGTCPTADTTITLTNKVLPIITGITTTDPSNCGNTDGTITIAAYSPDGTLLQYSIDGGATHQNNGIFTGLPEGHYQIRVRNVGGTCEHGRDVMLTVPPSSITITNITKIAPTNCNSLNGQITITATGNNLEYSIDGLVWQSSPTFTGLYCGQYQVHVREFNTVCEVSQLVTLGNNSSSNIVALNDTFHILTDVPLDGNMLLNDLYSIQNILGVNTTPIVPPFHGTIIMNPNGLFTYTPDSGFTGIDHFQYEVCIGYPITCKTATVYINVYDSTAHITTVVDTIILNNTTQTINVLNNDSHSQGLPLSAIADYQWNSNGALTLDTLGNLTINPIIYNAGSNTFTYVVCEQGNTNACQVGIVVILTDTAVYAIDDNFYTGRTGNYGHNVLNNDIHNTNDLLTVTPQSTNSYTLNTNGQLTVNADSLAIGAHSLTYQVCAVNQPNLCDSADVSFTVYNNNPPNATNDNLCVYENETVAFNLLLNDYDIDGNYITISTQLIEDPAIGVIICNPDGNCSYNTSSGYIGSDTARYLICDDGYPSLCDTGLIVVDVKQLVINPITTDANNCNDGSITIHTSRDSISSIFIQYEYTIDSGLTWQNSPIFANLVAGQYEVGVRVKYQPYFSNSTTYPITINSSSNITLSPSYTGNTLCVDGTTDLQLFTNNTGLVAAYTWTGPNNYGNTVANPILTNVTATNSGTYYITVVDTAGCSKTDSIVLNITDKPYNAQLSVPNPTICLNSSITLFGNSYHGLGSVDYNWWISDSSLLPINTQLLDSTLTITPIDTGIITVKYWVTINDCDSDLDSVQITILPNPIIDSVTLNGNPNCVNGNTTLQLLAHSSNTGIWSWTGPNGAAFTTQNIIIPNATSAESGVYSVTATDFNGCQTTVNQTINITDAIHIDTVYYSYDTAVVIASGGFGNYEYSFDCGATWQSSSVFYPALAGTQCIGVRNAMDSSCTIFVNPTFNSTPPVGVADTVRLVADLMSTAFNTTFDILANDYDLEVNHLFIKTDSLISSGILLGLVNNDGTVNYTPTTQWMQLGNLTNFTYEVCEIHNPTICDTSNITVFVRAPYDYTPDFIEDTIAIGANRTICMPLEELRLGLTAPDSLYFVWNNLSNVLIDSITNNQCLYLHGESYGTDTTYIVITDDYGFSDTITLAITIEDGVWPGDTDDDTQVDNFDLLNIGLGYGTTGTSRDSVSIVWDGFITPEWNITTPTSNIDYRHLDCNGDGIINANDTTAIIQNWGRSYQKSGGGSVLNGVPIFIPADTNYSLPHFSLPVMLGNMGQPAIDVYGGAFSVSYDTNYIKKNSVFITFDSSWIGTLGTDMISIERNDPDRQQVDAAFTRIDAMNITGFGQIAELNFTIKDDILQKSGFNADSVILRFDIFRTKFIKYSEEIIDINEKVTNMVITKTKQTPLLEQYVSVFPNPVTHQLHINSGQLQMEAISLINVNGQVIHQEQFHPQHTHTLPVHTYSSGVYLLRIQTKRGVVTKRITIVR